MMDTVFIYGLKIDTVIGVFDWEREIKQTIELDIEMAHNNRPAGQSDKLVDALNYKVVTDAVTSFVAASQFELVESLAENIVDMIRRDFGVPWVKLILRKPSAIPSADCVGVQLVRGDQ